MTQEAGSDDVVLEHVTKRFGDYVAVRDMDLRVRRGEFFSLLGPSGCGKTTTLRMVAGFEHPTTGEIYVANSPMAGVPPYKRPVNTVFQNYGLFPHLNVWENVAFGLKRKKVSRADVTRRVGESLEMVEMDKMTQRRPSELSGGQQQRVALARALVNQPTVLLLDEPLGALDAKLRKAMQLELKKLQGDVGITFIYVTHDQEEALTMSDRIAVMSEGQVVQVGPPTDVYDRPRTRFVSEFLGTANIFTGTVAGAAEGGVTIALDMQPGAAGTIAAAGLTPGQRVTIALRPEKLRIGPPVATAIKAVVQDVVFRGTYFAYELIAPGQDRPIFLYSQTREPIPTDGLVGLTWPPDSAVILADEP